MFFWRSVVIVWDRAVTQTAGLLIAAGAWAHQPCAVSYVKTANRMVRVIADKPPVLQRQVRTRSLTMCLCCSLMWRRQPYELGLCCGWGREISLHGFRLPFCLCTCGESISLWLFSLKGTENCNHSTVILKMNTWVWCTSYILCF